MQKFWLLLPLAALLIGCSPQQPPTIIQQPAPIIQQPAPIIQPVVPGPIYPQPYYYGPRYDPRYNPRYDPRYDRYDPRYHHRVGVGVGGVRI